MPRFLYALLCSFLLLSVVRPAEAQERSRQSYDVAAFTEVGLSVPGTLHLRQGDARSVEVDAPQKVLDELEVTVDDNRLRIRDDENGLERLFGGDGVEGKIDAYVTMPTIETISLAGSGTILGETPLESSSLTLENAGSGEIELEVKTNDLRMNTAGSGDMRIRGTAETVDIRIAGSGTVSALDLTTATASIDVAGSGDVSLHVTDQLSANIMGSGDVTYRGSPSLDTNTLGSGEIKSAE